MLAKSHEPLTRASDRTSIVQFWRWHHAYCYLKMVFLVAMMLIGDEDRGCSNECLAGIPMQGNLYNCICSRCQCWQHHRRGRSSSPKPCIITRHSPIPLNCEYSCKPRMWIKQGKAFQAFWWNLLASNHSRVVAAPQRAGTWTCTPARFVFQIRIATENKSRPSQF